MVETIGLVGASSRGTQIDLGANDTKPAIAAGNLLGTATADFEAMVIHCRDVETSGMRGIFDVVVDTTEFAKNLMIRGKPGVAFNEGNFPVWRGGGKNTDEIHIIGQTDNSIDRYAHFTATLLGAGDLRHTPGTVADTYGANLTTTTGVVLDPTVAHTEISVVEITTSGGLDNAADLLIFSVNSGGDNAIAGQPEWIIRIYIGAAGATFTGIAFIAGVAANIDHAASPWHPFEVDRSVFASGVRVWATIQSSIVVAGDREAEIVLSTFQTALKGAAGAGGGEYSGQSIITVAPIAMAHG